MVRSTRSFIEELLPRQDDSDEANNTLALHILQQLIHGQVRCLYAHMDTYLAHSIDPFIIPMYYITFLMYIHIYSNSTMHSEVAVAGVLFSLAC